MVRSVRVDGGWHLNCLGVFCLQRFVKTSTPLTLYLQMLCPLKPQSSVTFDAASPTPKKRSNAWAMALLLGLWAGWAGAQTAGHAQLNEGARQWVAEQTQTPLRSYDLKAAQMVRRGQQVMVSVGAGTGFLITLRAEAQQDGILGEQIRLKNPESGRSLSAVITGFNAARAM